MALFAYLQQVQRFLEYDERQAIFNPADNMPITAQQQQGRSGGGV